MELMTAGEAYRAVLAAEMFEAEAETPLYEMDAKNLRKYVAGLGIADAETMLILRLMQNMGRNEMYKAMKECWGVKRAAIQADTEAAVFRKIVYLLPELIEARNAAE